MGLYNSTGGAATWQRHDGWGSTASPDGGNTPPYCTWDGVQCHPDGSVNALVLSFNGLTGVLPAGLCDCANVTDLQLSGNALSGPIPPCMATAMRRLQSVQMAANTLNGTLPPLLHTLSRPDPVGHLRDSLRRSPWVTMRLVASGRAVCRPL